MIENEVEVFLEFELPNFSRDDINVDIKENSISVKASKSKSEKDMKDGVEMYEESSENFSYSSSLPKVDNKKAKIDFTGGKLKITIPKK